ncbi:UDP-N-acetylmuramoyl-L-alanine--D-glutamate ligase [Parasaccharibacter sp. TMW 2.1884]|uniref:UDP-N-acetylmuramoyl-L-alanine--D-glutamate ligase n=1 Tax=Parasaccharibacter sp. TMW 2.1884 TaxID=2267834 RepID=UPI001318AD5C|nr:UDP-N-acetylmuramoyl-L-alanine--D-glutamate ligase [Parasaccharibacter sp. TMW 2.1884]MCL1511538.1 UDP-N-acetylmuramoyl-L-alanine--D-glutamate ligase [Parasaccharibacter sp. TMW 2.1884]QGT75275.1 UDP-N-acetylmuramoyl-L-alanine--D-glutamate ligase [Bombella sp. ESL0368]
MTVLPFPPPQKWPATLLTGQHHAVCGLGRNGAAVVQALLDMGATVQAWDDSRPELPAPLSSHPRLTLAPLTDLTGMDALILSPGIPHHLPRPHPAALLAREQHVPILSDAELLWQVARKAGSCVRFVSITGTNGKSTTTALLTHILTQAGIPACCGGNFGTASLALPALGDDGVYVIEMSSYMLERLKDYHACAAALLNLTPDHLDRHGSMQGYLDAKAHVFDNMTAGDLAILGEKASWADELHQRLERQGVTVRTFSITQPVPETDAPFLPGQHNAQNIETCRTIARHLGLSEEQIAEGIRSFTGLDHRLQLVAQADGISFINDSKATNAEASYHALKAFPESLWIAGGMAKEGGIESLAPLFGHVRRAFLIGQDAPLLARTLTAHDVPFEISETLEQATRAAWDHARTHEAMPILLSPACASFDQFRNFEERGTAFATLARSLCGED